MFTLLQTKLLPGAPIVNAKNLGTHLRPVVKRNKYLVIFVIFHWFVIIVKTSPLKWEIYTIGLIN